MDRILTLEESIPVIKKELVGFANNAWNGNESWRYSLSPLILAGEAQRAIHSYKWLGSILNLSLGEYVDVQLDSLLIDSTSNYNVRWDFARPSVLGGFYIHTMKFYEQHLREAGATCYFLVEIGCWVRPTQGGLRLKLNQLLEFLHNKPFQLQAQDLADDYRQSLGSGLELSIRLVSRYR